MDKLPLFPVFPRGARSPVSMRHTKSGLDALVAATDDGYVVAQFDLISHPHAHGWHKYQHDEFEPIPEDPPEKSVQERQAESEAYHARMRASCGGP